MRPGAARPLRARRQHALLLATLESLGADLVRLPFVHGAFDSVFTKDSAVLAERNGVRHALLSRFGVPERRGEEAARRRHLEALGFSVLDAPPLALEGGDVVPIGDEVLLLGHGFRSHRANASRLEAFLQREVVALELTDPWLYHLDTALTALEDGTVICCREALAAASLRALERHRSVRELLFVPHGEASRFALNVVQIGGTIVSGTLEAPEMTRLLERRGLRVIALDLSQFHLAGGSAACLVGRLHQDRRVTTSATTAIRSTSA